MTHHDSVRTPGTWIPGRGRMGLELHHQLLQLDPTRPRQPIGRNNGIRYQRPESDMTLEDLGKIGMMG